MFVHDRDDHTETPISVTNRRSARSFPASACGEHTAGDESGPLSLANMSADKRLNRTITRRSVRAYCRCKHGSSRNETHSISACVALDAETFFRRNIQGAYFGKILRRLIIHSQINNILGYCVRYGMGLVIAKIRMQYPSVSSHHSVTT